ncbi:hypothetical protein E4U10_007093 [Claviceps purpurea]|nr:hypothetical protein E4U10_007093 [Claviceps purpurea]
MVKSSLRRSLKRRRGRLSIKIWPTFPRQKALSTLCSHNAEISDNFLHEDADDLVNESSGDSEEESSISFVMSAADHLFDESPLTSHPDEPFGKSAKRPDEDSDVVFADLFDDGSATRIKDLVGRDSADEKRAPRGGGSIDNEELDGSLESPRNGHLFTRFGSCPTESHKQKRKEKEMLRGEFATAVYTFSWEFASAAHALSSVDEASLNHKKRLTPPAPKLPLAPMMPLTPIR